MAVGEAQIKGVCVGPRGKEEVGPLPLFRAPFAFPFTSPLQPGRQWRLAWGALGPALPRSAACPGARQMPPSPPPAPAPLATLSLPMLGGDGHTQGGPETALGVEGTGMVPNDVHVLIPGIGSYVTLHGGGGVKVADVILGATQLTLRWGDSRPCSLGLAPPHIVGVRVVM